MGTHVQTCKPSEGWDWLTGGLQLFRKKPGELFLLGNAYLFLVLFPALLIPTLGTVIVTLITPGLSAGIMLAGKMASRGQRVTPRILFAGFFQDSKKHLHPLLILGGGYAVCFAIIKMLSFAILGSGPEIPETGIDLGDPQVSAAFTEHLVTSSLFLAVASVPVVLTFWYAPALVIWHEMSAPKALFASLVAMWRNKAAFLIYGMGWVIMVIGFVSIITFVFSALGLPVAFLGVLHLMTTSLVMGVSIATVYPTYAAVFERDPGSKLDILV